MGRRLPWFRSKLERWRTLLAEYGAVALVVYFALWIGTYVAILTGLWVLLPVEGTAAGAGLAAGAYVLCDLTTPLRLVVTLAITPKLRAAWKGQPPSDAPAGDDG